MDKNKKLIQDNLMSNQKKLNLLVKLKEEIQTKLSNKTKLLDESDKKLSDICKSNTIAEEKYSKLELE